MTMLHFFYQTRWALRNDPALGFFMALFLCVFIEWHAMVRALRDRVTEHLVMAVVTMNQAQGGGK